MAEVTPAAEAAVGGLLASSPFWAVLIHDVSSIAYAVTGVCGAIMAVHGVARIVVDMARRKRPPEKEG